MEDFNSYFHEIETAEPNHMAGKVEEVLGYVIRARNPGLNIGGHCRIFNPKTKQSVPGEAVGFKQGSILVMPLGDIRGVGPDSLIIPTHEESLVPVGPDLLGRCIDGLGQPIDDGPPLEFTDKVPLHVDPINPLKRRRISEPLDVGIKAINGMLTCGKGQRVAILAGSGVGKSVLLGMMAKNTSADVNVIALIGERGREVKEFIERDLGPEGLKHSVVVAATSDQSPLVRIHGAYMAIAIAEYFRAQGKDVLFLMDSVSRWAQSQREVGLAVGEPPTTKGYPPSVFSLMPKLLERAGNSESKGSITGFYTVLVEGDDPNEPIGDAVRSIVDGHVLLDREIAAQGHYPAIDVLRSKSRVMVEVASQSLQENASKLLQTFANYKEAEDLINIGAYVKGSNARIDYSIKKINQILGFLRQGTNESFVLLETEALLEQIFKDFPKEMQTQLQQGA